ncbi:Clp protease N-terminal domain-containing protein [Streptacidiphilus fuscans]|uniref:ATP-dependent Clp protease ATP-binding subunit n=1 Tax=Streptacidiphilus fuscans TaxID=2789292 RepID=A0A931BA48_9ACTN|nr:Clp protease N-terminal domain-containing protein [Streptacidiphilus fuscans]MBF9071457.1 ATP-dependent Clp protease ATP-binding subunit [Streptacidiphilus fuscans]
MPKINVYLPDELAAAVKAAEIPVSAVCQKALADAVQVVTVARKGIAALRNPDFDPDARPEFATRLAARMTDRLRTSIELGREAAAGRPVGTGSLLVGMIDEGGNLAVRLLQALDEDIDELREAALTSTVEEPMPTAAAMAATGGATGGGEGGFWSGMTLPVRSAIGAALEASIDLGHNYIGCEHLLLGLLADPESGAGRVLSEAGLDASAVRRSISSALAGFAQSRATAASAASATTAALDRVVQRLDAIERRLGEAGL